MHKNLEAYGYSYQIKVLTGMLIDNIFLNQIQDILKAEYFESESNKNILKFIKEYHAKYNIPPTIDALKYHTVSINNDTLKESVAKNVREIIKSIDAKDLQSVKDDVLIFCRQQEFKIALDDCSLLLEEGKLDNILDRIQMANRSGNEKFNFYDYKKEFEQRYVESDRNTIPTNWEIINDIIDGGLGRGELGLFISPAGVGNTWSLINVGGTALRAGKTVFHYTLELHENYTARRYDSFLSGVKFQTLKHNLESVEPIVKNIKGQLIVEYQPSGTLTVNQIAAHIDKSIMNGIKPDLIIVDYADLLRCSNGGGKNSDKRQELSSIYIELRGLAGKYNIPVWTATQSNREGAKSNVVKGTDVSEDYSKIMTCDVIISLQRNDNDKEKGYGRWYMVKNRFGPDGITFPSKINTDNGSVQIYAPKSLEGEAISKNMVDQEESDRQKFASSYKSTRVEKKTFVPNGTANNSPKPLTKFSS